jgi:hypothetical protein
MQDSKQSAKVLCAISHGLYEPWLSILNDGQRLTWLSEKFPDNFEVLHYHATPVGKLLQKMDKLHEKIRWKNRYVASLLCLFDNFILAPLINFIPRSCDSKLLTTVENVIHIKFPDTYLTYRWKFLSLLRYFIYETNSDFLFITSTASYVQPDLVLKFVSEIPDRTTYAGAEPYEGAGFISGSNRIISREIAMSSLESLKKWKPGVIEDVEFTRLVQANGHKLMTFPIANIDSVENLLETPDVFINRTYHFRLKSTVGGKRNDVEIMKLLHERVLRLKNRE